MVLPTLAQTTYHSYKTVGQWDFCKKSDYVKSEMNHQGWFESSFSFFSLT